MTSPRLNAGCLKTYLEHFADNSLPLVCRAILQKFFDYIAGEFLFGKAQQTILNDDVQNRFPVFLPAKLQDMLNYIVSVLVIQKCLVTFTDFV